MFFGTTPPIISQWIFNEIKTYGTQKVYEPFAGNFVVSQLCGLIDKNIHVVSTDVSLYSMAIGFGVMEKDFGLTYSDAEHIQQFDYFLSKTDPLSLAIGVIFFNEVAKNLKKNHVPYYKNMNVEVQKNQQRYYQDIEKKILGFKENLGNFDFKGTCGVQLLNDCKENDFVFYDPPVILGDYEKQYRPLQECFKYEEPFYTEMTDEVKLQNLIDLSERGCKVFYRTNEPIDYLPENFNLVFKHQYKSNGFYCIYTNKEDSKLFVNRFNPVKESQPNFRTIGIEDEITENSEIKVVRVDGKTANHYRLMWVKKAEMKDAGTPFLIFIDGKLIGLFQIMDAMRFGNSLAVIISDPACPHSKYKRLSKLIMYLCCTKETLKDFNDMTMWHHDGFTTIVFTNAAVSMKYRGFFDLHERKENDGFFKNKLVYQNKKNIFDTYRDALKHWVKKDSHIQNSSELYD
jgi:hypothetical protein